MSTWHFKMAATITKLIPTEHVYVSPHKSVKRSDLNDRGQFQTTSGAEGRAVLTSARPGSVVEPCCTILPTSSQEEGKGRSTWMG